MWLKTELGVSVPLFHSNGGSQKADRLDPFLAEMLAQRRTWGVKKPKREALSGDMLEVMHSLAAQAASVRPWCLDCVLYDIVVVGCFTGSRLSEYGQSLLNPPSSESGPHPSPYWAPLPSNCHVPAKWRGTPEAFILDDFTFFSQHQERVALDPAGLAAPSIHFVHVRTRYDKSNHNMVVRKFQRIHDHPFCVVRATISLALRRLNGLGQLDEPLGMFLGPNNRRLCVRDWHLKKFFERACFLAHPNPNHYLRLNVHLLRSHSLRITAAVILHNAGVPIDDIKFRLRWYSNAVQQYLRDCPRTMYWLSAKAFDGAFVDQSATGAP